MNVLIIDAQGGGIGRQLVAAMKKRFPKQMITAVGTNSDNGRGSGAEQGQADPGSGQPL